MVEAMDEQHQTEADADDDAGKNVDEDNARERGDREPEVDDVVVPEPLQLGEVDHPDTA